MINIQKVKEVLLSLAGRLWQRIQDEPLLIRTGLAWLASAGVLELTDAQITTVQAVVSTAILLFGSVAARRVVKPIPKQDREPIIRGKGKGDKKSGRAA